MNLQRVWNDIHRKAGGRMAKVIKPPEVVDNDQWREGLALSLEWTGRAIRSLGDTIHTPRYVSAQTALLHLLQAAKQIQQIIKKNNELVVRKQIINKNNKLKI